MAVIAARYRQRQWLRRRRWPRLGSSDTGSSLGRDESSGEKIGFMAIDTSLPLFPRPSHLGLETATAGPARVRLRASERRATSAAAGTCGVPDGVAERLNAAAELEIVLAK